MLFTSELITNQGDDSMSKTRTNSTINSLEALAVLLPLADTVDSAAAEPADVLADYIEPSGSNSGDPLSDDVLLGLASRLQQALQQWRTQMVNGALLDAQARDLLVQHEQLANQLERSRVRWRQQKGRRTLQDLLDSLGTDVPCFDAETSRLFDAARRALDGGDRRMEESLHNDLAALQALTEQMEAIETDPAVQVYRAEQERQTTLARWQQLLDQAQTGYREARQAHELEAVHALVSEIEMQTAPDSPPHAQAQQLLAMVASDMEQARAAEAEAAERAARAGFGKWLKTVNRRRGADDLVLTFGIGQGVHVALTEQRTGKGHRRAMLVSAVGFELVEPVVRTLVPQPSRAGYFQLQPATGLPAGGHGRQFEWQHSGRRPGPTGRRHCSEAVCELSS
jgi:hypothetical protein